MTAMGRADPFAQPRGTPVTAPSRSDPFALSRPFRQERPRRSAPLRLAVVAFLLVIAGCACPPAPRLETELASMPAPTARAPYRIAIAPLEIDPAVARLPLQGEYAAAVVPEIRSLRSDLMRAVEASGAAQETIFLEALAEHERPPMAGALPEGAAFAVPAPAAPEAIAAAAFGARADLVLTTRLVRHRVRYDGRNARFIPNILNFFFAVWTAWLVADERYAGEIALDAELRAVGSGEVIWRKHYDSSVVKDLDHFQRGWSLLGIFTVPGSLEPTNYRTVAETVLPYARNDLALALAKDLREGIAESRDPSLRPRLAKTLGVVAGVGRHEAIDDLSTPDADAAAFSALLRDSMKVPERNLLTLDGAEPTRERFLEAVRDRASRARPGDSLFVYFSGYGYGEGKELYLVPSDVDPGRPAETAIPLGALEQALAPAAGVRQVVVLETSFAPALTARAALRTLVVPTTGRSPAPLESVEAISAALDRFARGRTVVLASEPGRAARERSPAGEDPLGLLTANLVAAARTRANDLDRDGTVDLSEAFAAAQRESRRVSKRAGYAQVPVVLGLVARDVRLGQVAE
jgi:hypothetical protein